MTSTVWVDEQAERDVTELDERGLQVDAAPDSSETHEQGGREPVRMSLFWAISFPVAMVVVGILGYSLFRSGTEDVLDNTGGAEVSEVVTDPNAPGWTAVVVPTPTSMTAHTTAEGALVGITVLVGHAEGAEGGSFLVLPSNTALIPPGEEQAITLSELYAERDLAAVTQTVGSVFGFGFVEPATVLDSEALEAMLGLVAPLDIEVLDPIVGPDGLEIVLEPGLQSLDAAELAYYFEVVNDGEALINRTERQRQVWNAWFERLVSAEGQSGVLPEFDEGIAAFLAEMAGGSVGDVTFPVTPFSPDGGLPLYVLNDEDHEEVAAIAAALVPLPIEPYPGGRAKVELRDGAGDSERRDAAVTPLVGAGAEMRVIGNASVFATEATEIVYFGEEYADLASALADALDAGEPQRSESEESAVDVFVTLGADWRDAS